MTARRRTRARRTLLVLHALIGIAIGGTLGGGHTDGNASLGDAVRSSSGTAASAAAPPADRQPDRVGALGVAAANPSACGQCHVAGRKPVADYNKPECRECHVPSARDGGHAGDGTTRPSFIPVALPEHQDKQAPHHSAAQPPHQSIIKQKMILIPAGPFWMGNNGRGADGPGDEDERPLHQVMVEAYLIDKYETTNAMYKEFVDATKHDAPKLWQNGTYPPDKTNHPVVYVSWHDALEFCQWAGKRLPIEAEWEKAARSTDKRVFPWGNQFDPMKANTPQYWMAIHQTEQADTMPVGSFEAGKSPYGLYDMAGNVYEWVNDWYLPYPGNQFPNQHYGFKNKIVRGGSWYDCLSYGCGLSSPTYNRSRFNPDIRNKGFGFRCAKSPAHHAKRATSRSDRPTH
ncbi:MAG TPA: SUMF1/EgtB/PvdO family nonheme iron enzyme [Nitrospiria bacterium]|nr:SUMF1/EgtB/PvdO family nonheme iron enzyme [Nitrospiria bacterium]